MDKQRISICFIRGFTLRDKQGNFLYNGIIYSDNGGVSGYYCVGTNKEKCDYIQ